VCSITNITDVLQGTLLDHASAQLAQQSEEAADNLSVSNAIMALRLLGDADWRGLILRTSVLMQQMQASADFLSAASTSDLKAREAVLGKIAAEGGTYGVLARFRLAETAIEAGDKAKARGILGEIAKDGGADKALRDLALIQAALLELEIGKPGRPPTWSRI
jgi:hypothetical protein